jgi:hypothetical protein
MISGRYREPAKAIHWLAEKNDTAFGQFKPNFARVYPIFTPSPPIAARAFNTSSPNQNLRF